MTKSKPTSSSSSSKSEISINVPSAPVYYPTETEFSDPLEYISKIRAEAERYGACKIVPPASWKPPFGFDLGKFRFMTKSQEIHRLQCRSAGVDEETFGLEYGRFLEGRGRRRKKRSGVVVFKGEELGLCGLFNAVKRFGGYDRVVREKKWGEVCRFAKGGGGAKVSECTKHVLCQLYREHLYDYEVYCRGLSKGGGKGKRGCGLGEGEGEGESESSRKRRKGNCGDKVEVETGDQICEQCNSGLHEDVMLLCDRCDKGWHIYCLSPPLKEVPLGNWYCFECLNSDKDIFGFVPGKRYSIEAFKRIAERAKRRWFGSGTVSRVQIERKFWEIVEGLIGDVEVMYGSDLDTSVYGSGFPCVNNQKPESVDDKMWEKYCASPWNLNNLPKLKGSMLRAVNHNITGVMVPWLYIGMLFSAFCWHFEDHCFYSMNYHHWGEPKCWYSVPGSKANAFEKVMQNTLPDLFDAQPDLLFQLVTMLNPSVLQENGVPVYSVIQEPGNFVITFPRSYHGGFNFGLNCAEAVNFAPADWLPYGGFGAELYKLYHRAPVLSHEELLCVVAKSDLDIKVSTYLKEELVKLYTKEKVCREYLWRNGIVKSSPLPPKKCPEYVANEEDPMCIICLQYLYLSAVVCPCRASSFVCLEHWNHLCECRPSKLRLLYRHSLAELNNFVLNMEYHTVDRASHTKNVKQSAADSDDLGALKKDIGGNGTMAQLAEQWLLYSSKVFQNEFSSKAYRKAVKEAEQFLWADSEMDPVRTMVKNLIEAKKWAEGVRDCVSKIEDWSFNSDHSYERVDIEDVDKFLIHSSPLCNEPSYIKLKKYAEEAKVLIREIEAARLTCVNMSDLELLHSKSCELPIHVKESKKLAHRISSAKVWVANVRKCLSEKRNGAIHLSFLHRLKAENLELQVHFAETEMLLYLLAQAESYQARYKDVLGSPITLQNVEAFLQEVDGFTVSIPEVEILRQQYDDAVSWVSCFKCFVVNVHEREDQDSVIVELTGMLNDGKLLKIQVDELAHVDVELRKACCRAKALKAQNSLMSLEFIQEVMLEASKLQVETERLFININEVLVNGKSWEERAKCVLAIGAEISEFRDLLRSSEDICMKLPSLVDIQDAVLVAESWLKRAKRFLDINHSMTNGLSSYLKVDALKELVFESKLLKASLEEQKHLKTLLKQCEIWELDACRILQDVKCLNNTSEICGVVDSLVLKINQLIDSLKSITKSGLSLGVYFEKIPELRNACSFLRWCNKALSFCSVAPSLEEVEGLMEIGKDISATYTSGAMWGKIFDGIRWLNKAVRVSFVSSNDRMCKLSEAEKVLVESQKNQFPFPEVIGQLAVAIEKQKMWQEEARQYFSLQFEERTCLTLLHLKDVGSTLAFGCLEVDRVLSEIRKIEDWSQYCRECLGISFGDLNPLLGALLKVEESLRKSLRICESYKSCRARKFCICCSSVPKKQKYLMCSLCTDWYHQPCLANTLLDTDATKVYTCHYCLFVESGSISQIGDNPMRFQGMRPYLKTLIELLAASKDFCVSVALRDALQQLVGQALSFRACLSELLNSASNYLDKNVSELKVLSIAVKATDLAGVCDCQINHHLEMALERYRWRNRAKSLLKGLQKPTIQQIKWLIKEGLAADVPSEDYLRQKLTDMKSCGVQWTDSAKKVSADSGALGLDKVFELIMEGENLPVNVEKELELLRTRSMLYCICRKPYDQRAMIACDQCDEWYHFDCINLAYSPEEFLCPACQPETAEYHSTSVLADYERSASAAFAEPRTPSPRHTRMKKQLKTANYRTVRESVFSANLNSRFRSSSSEEHLCWRNKKPFRRLAKKRSELVSLAMFPS